MQSVLQVVMNSLFEILYMLFVFW